MNPEEHPKRRRYLLVIALAALLYVPSAQAGHVSSRVASYTGCLVTSGSLVGQVKKLRAASTPIGGSCPSGSVVIHLSGGDVTNVNAGTGLQGGASNGSATLSLRSGYRLPQGCIADQVAKWNGSAWSCAIEGGTTWHYGTGLPDAQLGRDGDFFVDTGTSEIRLYVKFEGGWLFLNNLRGPKGDRGERGPIGDQGIGWLTGAGAPTTAMGRTGELYLDSETGDVYTKIADGTWLQYANLRGPEGAAGPQGPPGTGQLVTAQAANRGLGGPVEGQYVTVFTTPGLGPGRWAITVTANIVSFYAECRLELTGAEAWRDVMLDDVQAGDSTVYSSVSMTLQGAVNIPEGTALDNLRLKCLGFGDSSDTNRVISARLQALKYG